MINGMKLYETLLQYNFYSIHVTRCHISLMIWQKINSVQHLLLYVCPNLLKSVTTLTSMTVLLTATASNGPLQGKLLYIYATVYRVNECKWVVFLLG